MQAERAISGFNQHVGLRVGEQEKTHPAQPHHRPSDLISAEFVGKVAAECPQHTAGQREAGGQKGGGFQAHAVFAHIIFGHPQGQRHIAAEHHRIILAVTQHARVFQQRELFAQGNARRNQMLGIVIAGEPENHRHRQHNGRIHGGHNLPSAVGGNQPGRQKFIHGRAGIARAEHAHRHALLVFRKPARHIRRAHRKRAAGQAHQQADNQEMPIMGGVLHQENGGHGNHHQRKQHDAAAVAVGEYAQRHAD